MAASAALILTDWTWILTGLIAVITVYFVKHLQKVWSLPPGPFPYPVLGNLLMLRGDGNDLSKVLVRMKKRYGDIFTLWLGYQPTVVACNWELCHEALISKRNDFAGRVIRDSNELFLGKNHDVAFSDFGPAWDVLRKVMAAAVRKYAVSESLAELVSDVVDRTAEAMEKEGKPVDAKIYVYLMLYNILASSAFGQRFELDDPEFVLLRKNNDDFNESFGVGLPSDAIPILKIFYGKKIKEIKKQIDIFQDYVRKRFKEHVQTYQSGDVRDFTDAVLAAREEAEEEIKGELEHLSEENLILVLVDLFTAGTDTSRAYLEWTLLLITEQPQILKRMQEEIDQNIGSRLPVQNDKLKCPYVHAVLTEVLRLKPVVDFSLEHKTICNTELGRYKIPKDTSCLFYIKGSQYDYQHWVGPDKFKPERFLGPDGKFLNTRITGYMPFSLGRRACPGEKLALADVFLIVARLLQKYDFQLVGDYDINFDASGFTKETAPYYLRIKKRDR